MANKKNLEDKNQSNSNITKKRRGRPPKNAGLRLELITILPGDDNKWKRELYDQMEKDFLIDFPDLNNSSDRRSLHQYIMTTIRVEELHAHFNDPKNKADLLDKDKTKILDDALKIQEKYMQVLSARRSDRPHGDSGISISDIAEGFDTKARKEKRIEQDKQEKELMDRKLHKELILPTKKETQNVGA